mmetsp:Transcript_10563/g.26605  ORF Transcript_10563/g.26605 Transcript_10563/m.26605 type:complete len:257 (+) Transcript_10563:2215-2985(+)
MRESVESRPHELLPIETGGVEETPADAANPLAPSRDPGPAMPAAVPAAGTAALADLGAPADPSPPNPPTSANASSNAPADAEAGERADDSAVSLATSLSLPIWTDDGGEVACSGRNHSEVGRAHADAAMRVAESGVRIPLPAAAAFAAGGVPGPLAVAPCSSRTRSAMEGSPPLPLSLTSASAALSSRSVISSAVETEPATGANLIPCLCPSAVDSDTRRATRGTPPRPKVAVAESTTAEVAPDASAWLFAWEAPD